MAEAAEDVKAVLLIRADEAQEAGDWAGTAVLWLKSTLGPHSKYTRTVHVSTGSVWLESGQPWMEVGRPDAADLFFCERGRMVSEYWYRDGVWEFHKNGLEWDRTLPADPPDFVVEGVRDLLRRLASGEANVVEG